MTHKGTGDDQSIVPFPGIEEVHCTVQELDDLVSMARRASLILVDRDKGRIVPPMTLFGQRLDAIAVTSRRYNAANCRIVERSQLESLYWQICRNFSVHSLANLSSDEDTMCIVFADPSIVEYRARIQIGSVVRYAR